MAAKTRASKRTSRKPARKPARPKARARTRKAARPRPRRKAVARKPARSRKPAVARRAKKRAAPAAKKRTAPARKTARKIAPRTKAARPSRPAAPARKPAARTRLPFQTAPLDRGQRPALDRNRRVLSNEERFDRAGDMTTPGEDTARMLSAVRTGRDEFREQLEQHTESSPRLTAGDVDAKWQDAYAVGDEAPGGDNPTPDQDIVDDIGRALGVEYEDDEELKGADKLEERDRHRWELDPASSEDWPHDK